MCPKYCSQTTWTSFLEKPVVLARNIYTCVINGGTSTCQEIKPNQTQSANLDQMKAKYQFAIKQRSFSKIFKRKQNST
jgi:Xaa-Pro aminopeptidase